MRGFCERAVHDLDAIKCELGERLAITSTHDAWTLASFVAPGCAVLPTDFYDSPLHEASETAALTTLHRLVQRGYKARLVACRTELRDAHLIVEVVCPDGTQSYYFDHRRHGICSDQAMTGYYLYAASPWNPIDGDDRPWSLLERFSH